MKLLVIVSQTPFGSSHVQESFDMALAVASFDAPVTVLLLGKGAFCLQNGVVENSERSDPRKLLKAFELYEIDRCLVNNLALEKYSITIPDDLASYVEVHQGPLNSLLADYDRVIHL